MEKLSPLVLLARATDTKGYPDDKDPSHWKTIRHAPVHIDKDGHIDGGAGGKFHGKPWSSEKHPHKAAPESYGGSSKKEEPAIEPKKTVEDLKAAWKKVAKERMEIHRAKTDKGRAAHEAKLDAAYKEYTDMRASMDPAEAAKFKPTSGGSAGSPKAAKATTPLASLAEATTPAAPAVPEESSEVKVKARRFEWHGMDALRYYVGFKKDGDATKLAKAKEELEEATKHMKDLPADSESFAKARKELVDFCKANGLTGSKLKDVFKEIKSAKAPEPTGEHVAVPTEKDVTDITDFYSDAHEKYMRAAPGSEEESEASKEMDEWHKLSRKASIASSSGEKIDLSKLVEARKASEAAAAEAKKAALERLASSTSGAAARAEVKSIRSKRPTLNKFTDHHDVESEKAFKSAGFTEEEAREFEAYMGKLFDDSDYGMNISGDNLLKVLSSGKFKNQYETGTGGGAVSESAIRSRAKIFGTLLGTGKTGRDAFPYEEREKYGSLLPKDPSFRGPSWYGDLVVRFKKENLKGRATYTIGDSLGFDPRAAKAAGDADHPSAVGFRSAGDGTTLRKTLNAFRKGQIKQPTDVPGASMYVEMQYHGDLLPTDIATVTFPNGATSATHRKLVAKLKAIGVECQDGRGKKL